MIMGDKKAFLFLYGFVRHRAWTPPLFHTMSPWYLQNRFFNSFGVQHAGYSINDGLKQ